jgi:ribosomal protein S18 acetylase RimI-like enzyme
MSGIRELSTYLVIYGIMFKSMSFEIYQAVPSDAPELAAVLQQAANFKLEHGDKLWGPKPFTVDEAEAMIDSGNAYIARVDGVVAVSTLLTWSDERMWGSVKGNDNQAGYIHRLSTADHFRRQGMGRRVIAWVEEQVKIAERPFVRLDCGYDTPLSSYYESIGFQEVERVDRPRSDGARNPDNPVYKAGLFQKSV